MPSKHLSRCTLSLHLPARRYCPNSRDSSHLCKEALFPFAEYPLRRGQAKDFRAAPSPTRHGLLGRFISRPTPAWHGPAFSAECDMFPPLASPLLGWVMASIQPPRESTRRLPIGDAPQLCPPPSSGNPRHRSHRSRNTRGKSKRVWLRTVASRPRTTSASAVRPPRRNDAVKPRKNPLVPLDLQS